MDRIRIEALQRAVQQHLAENGARNWKLVRSRFLDVPHATFWRTVKATRTPSALLDDTSQANKGEISFVGIFPPNSAPMKKLSELQEQIWHADNLIAQSMGSDGKIKNWQMNSKGVSLRQTALCHYVEMMQRLNNMNSMEGFRSTVMDIVAAAAPDLWDEIVRELRKTAQQSRERNQSGC